MSILSVNAGSSSIRLALHRGEATQMVTLARHHDAVEAGGESAILDSFLERNAHHDIQQIAHRVVHGGEMRPGAHLIDASLEALIESFSAVAPLHNPATLRWIRACRARLGARPQFAIFDTAFFHSLPQQASRYALPAELTQRHGLRRYGFHGIAHEAMWRHWQRLHGSGRVISLQLGSGCSITATRDGRPMDTSMGFSPLEGLVMATRSGDVDPGLLLHLLRSRVLDVDALETMLSHGSGLLGVSGTSGDMRQLLASDSDAARLAVDLYTYRARKYLGACLAVLGGTDAIVFGGGVGEHSPTIRAAILEGFDWAGIRPDLDANRRATGGTTCISAADSDIELWVVEVDEATLLAEFTHTASRLTSATEDTP
jgi:acetate kinase